MMLIVKLLPLINSEGKHDFIQNADAPKGTST